MSEQDNIRDSNIKALPLFDAATAYWNLGFKLLSIIPRAKNPAGIWGSTAKLDGETKRSAFVLPEYYQDETEKGIGVIGGKYSRIAVIDIDDRARAIEFFNSKGVDIEAYRTKTACFNRGNANKYKLVFRSEENIEYANLIHTEFRADEIHQDVFPPSVHPDGHQYVWEHPADQILTEEHLLKIPDEILSIWVGVAEENEKLTKNACKNLPRIYERSKEDNIFDVFNHLKTGAGALLDTGMYEQHGNRWKPIASDNTAGIVIFSSEVIASKHVGSDPMSQYIVADSSGTLTYTPFHIEVYLNCGGNVTRATANAYKYCESRGYVFHKEETEIGAGIANTLIENHVKKNIEATEKWIEESKNECDDYVQRPAEKIPEHLLSIPGKAQGLVDAYNKTAFIPQPQFAVQASLAIVATIMARRYRTDRLKNYTNMFFEVVGDSSSGKNHCKTFIKDVFVLVSHEVDGVRFEAIDLMSGGEYKSASGGYRACAKRPAHISIMDETGIKQESQNKSEHGSGITGFMLEVWSSATSLIQKGTFSGGDITVEDIEKDMKNQTLDNLYNPCVVKIGLSTQSTYYHSLRQGDINSGYLGRHLVVESDYHERDINVTAPDVESVITSGTLDWLSDLFAAYPYDTSGGITNPAFFMTCINNPVISPGYVNIHIPDECLMMFKQMYIDNILKYGNDNALVMKGMEIAVRVAMLVAGSCESVIIEKEHTQWAIDYVSYYLDRMVRTVELKISGSKYESDWKEIFEIIYEGKESGANARDFARKRSRSWHGANNKQRAEMIKTIETTKEIVFVQIETGKPGPKRYAWISSEFYNSDKHSVSRYDYDRHRVYAQ